LNYVQQLKIRACASPEILFISAVKTFGPGVKVKVHCLLRFVIKHRKYFT